MGKAKSGKTSMRSIIFANYVARDTMRLSPTLDVEHHHVQFLGDLTLNLWDCGGQDAFYESYFERDRETVFRNVEVLIYVFDISSKTVDQDLEQFENVLGAIAENSPDAKIFILVHKMDLVAKEEIEMILQNREEHMLQLTEHHGISQENVQVFGTSIWDETLYKAWSDIVTSMVPNVEILRNHLNEFCKICDADEVVLFEMATFLVISHSERDTHSQNGVMNHDTVNLENNSYKDVNDDGLEAHPTNNRPNQVGVSSGPFFDKHRHEKISNIVKQFKLCCEKVNSEFNGMEVTNSRFTAFIDRFTNNTFIMVITSKPGVQKAVTALNIKNARGHFERFIPQSHAQS